MSNSDLSILFFKFFIEFGLRKKLKKFVKNGCQVEKSMLYYHSCCGSAGIGRQARLRILWVYARVGSSPISRIQKKGQKALILFRFSAFFIVWMIRFFSHAVSRFWVVGLLYLVVAVGRIKPVGLFVRCWFGWKCNVLIFILFIRILSIWTFVRNMIHYICTIE